MTETGGLKYDGGKTRYDLLPHGPLEALAKTYTFGAKKYTDHNWRKGIAWSRVFGAVMRHMWAFWRGEDIDKESGLPHVAHAAWGCFALLEYMQEHPELDDRFGIWCQCKDERVCGQREDKVWKCLACHKPLKLA